LIKEIDTLTKEKPDFKRYKGINLINCTMLCKFLWVTLLVSSAFVGKSQQNVLNAEFGISLGSAFYFGDLNTRAQLNRSKPVMGISFRKAFGNYLGAKVSASFAQLGYSDIYSKNDFQKSRNLSFNTNIWELAATADFHFFKFNPLEDGQGFTPYLTLGVGLFSYDPYAFYQGKKIFLRPLNTEGQASAAYPDRKPYNTMAICIPFGMGIKYNLNERMNLTFEVSHRFTTTDYLDDVSKTYSGDANFPLGPDGLPTEAFLLQDRSGEIGPKIGAKDKQRGWSKQKDQYLFVQLGITFNIMKYNCPTY
jgi:Domain of unknown function (DUF6089)